MPNVQASDISIFEPLLLPRGSLYPILLQEEMEIDCLHIREVDKVKSSMLPLFAREGGGGA